MFRRRIVGKLRRLGVISRGALATIATVLEVLVDAPK
jgi:hypothetical protein